MMQRSCAHWPATTPHLPASDAVEAALKFREMSGPGTTHQVRSFEGGRVCVAGGCSTILSSYNPSSWCTVHDRLSPRARKGHGTRRPTDSRTCANPACGTVFESANAKRQYCSDTCRAMAFYARRHREENAGAR
jgi:hypothetical protein